MGLLAVPNSGSPCCASIRNFSLSTTHAFCLLYVLWRRSHSLLRRRGLNRLSFISFARSYSQLIVLLLMVPAGASPPLRAFGDIRSLFLSHLSHGESSRARSLLPFANTISVLNFTRARGSPAEEVSKRRSFSFVLFITAEIHLPSSEQFPSFAFLSFWNALR